MTKIQKQLIVLLILTALLIVLITICNKSKYSTERQLQVINIHSAEIIYEYQGYFNYRFESRGTPGRRLIIKRKGGDDILFTHNDTSSIIVIHAVDD